MGRLKSTLVGYITGCLDLHRNANTWHYPLQSGQMGVCKSTRRKPKTEPWGTPTFYLSCLGDWVINGFCLRDRDLIVRRYLNEDMVLWWGLMLILLLKVIEYFFSDSPKECSCHSVRACFSLLWWKFLHASMLHPVTPHYQPLVSTCCSHLHLITKPAYKLPHVHALFSFEPMPNLPALILRLILWVLKPETPTFHESFWSLLLFSCSFNNLPLGRGPLSSCFPCSVAVSVLVLAPNSSCSWEHLADIHRSPTNSNS